MAQVYSTGIELRFSDLDVYGHVNSPVYFTYLETARVKLFKDFFNEVSQQGIFTVVARPSATSRSRSRWMTRSSSRSGWPERGGPVSPWHTGSTTARILPMPPPAPPWSVLTT